MYDVPLSIKNIFKFSLILNVLTNLHLSNLCFYFAEQKCSFIIGYLAVIVEADCSVIFCVSDLYWTG